MRRAAALTFCALALAAPPAAAQGPGKKSAPPTQAEKDAAVVTGIAALGTAGVVGIACVLMAGVALQLLPVVIAVRRGHPDTLAITAVSLLLGWSCVGWVLALAWSLTGIEHRRVAPAAGRRPPADDDGDGDGGDPFDFGR